MCRTLAAAFLAAILLIGCGPSDTLRKPKNERVQSHRGDPENYTSSGFPRHVFPVEACESEIPLSPPFEVIQTGWGGPQIGAPLILLDQPDTSEIAESGIDAQSRISFWFPSRYERIGMREWFARAGPTPLSLEWMPSNLQSSNARRRGSRSGETRYVGDVRGVSVAVHCSATDWPNPTCKAEVPIKSSHLRYLATFPPSVAGRLDRIVEIGNGLFEDAATACRAARSAHHPIRS